MRRFETASRIKVTSISRIMVHTRTGPRHTEAPRTQPFYLCTLGASVCRSHGSTVMRLDAAYLPWLWNPRARRRGDVASFVHHEGAEKFDHDQAVLLEAGRPHLDDADVGTRLRLSLV